VEWRLIFATIPLVPRGNHFLLLRQKQVTKEKATSEIVLILRCSEKSGTEKTRYAQTVFRSDRFFSSDSRGKSAG